MLNQSGLIEVECDSQEAEAALQEMFGQVPPTPTWQSKRGKHRLFRRPPGLPEKATLELDGVEFRIGNEKGALSIVPPSVHPDGPRDEWLPELSLDEVEPAELPPAIVERLQRPTSQPPADAAAEVGIPEGKRNSTLFRKALSLRDLKLSEETVLSALLDLNERLCKPPLPEQEVRSIAASAMKREAKPAIGFLEVLISEIELWHDENDDPFMTLTQDGHRENWMIGKRSRPFRRWLSKKFYEATGETLSASHLADLASLLEGKAVFDGRRHRLFRRVAEHGGKFYLDLCDEAWRAVQISADGWRVVDEPPVKFRRAKAMQTLSAPKRSKASLKTLLLPFLNVRPEQWPLVAAWLAAALRLLGPYPLIKLLGEQGSAKTTKPACCVPCSIRIPPRCVPSRKTPTT